MSLAPPAPAAGEPRLSVSSDGALIAHVEADRIALLDGESLTVSGEIGIDPEAEGCDVALCGDPLRLIVLSRYASGARLHVIDPAGPTAVGELALRASLRLAGASGDHVWLLGGGGSTLVDIMQKDLVLAPLALRAPVNAVGACADGHFVVSTGGLIEEWAPENRAPARRFRLARPTPAQFVGGGARQVWMIPPDGDRLDVIPLVNVGQPARIELPEPPARVAADPGHEAVVILGARTGTAYLVDLTGKAPPVAIEGAGGTDIAWLGPSANVVVVSPANVVDVLPVTGRARGTAPIAPAAAPKPIAAPRSSMLTSPSAPAVPVASPPVAEPGGRASVPPPAASGLPAAARPAARPAGPAADASIADRLAALRERSRAAAPKEAPSAGWFTPPAPPSWRDRLARWAQGVMAGTRADAPPVGDEPAALVATRLGLGGELAEALWLIYGAHLAGVDGVSALDLSQVLDHRWDEALGHGRLAASGALRWRRSRVVLCPEVIAALDEGPPIGGAWIESAAEPPDRAVAVIAAPHVDLTAIARWIAPDLGPLLVAGERVRSLARRVLEARVRGGLAVVRWPPVDRPDALAPVALLVVPDEAAARAAQAPAIATWPTR